MEAKLLPVRTFDDVPNITTDVNPQDFEPLRQYEVFELTAADGTVVYFDNAIDAVRYLAKKSGTLLKYTLHLE